MIQTFRIHVVSCAIFFNFKWFQLTTFIDVVFDIINLNGTNLAGYPLESRLKILKTYVLEQHMYLQFIERKPRNTKEEVYSDLEQALLNR